MNKKLIAIVASGVVVGGTIGAILGQASNRVSDTVSPVQAVVETIKDIPDGDKDNKSDNTTPGVKEKDSTSVTEVTKQEKQTNTKAETKKAAKANKKVDNKKSETEKAANSTKEETKVTWQEEPDNSKYDKNVDYIYCYICGEPILGSSTEYGGEICHKECARRAKENDELIENYEKCYGNGDWEGADQWTSVHDWEQQKAQAQNTDEN